MGKEVRLRFLLLAVALVLPLFLWCKGVAAGDENYSFHLGGYVRTWVSVNLDNMPETDIDGDYDDRYKLSMVRGSLLLDCDATAGPFYFKVIGRGDQEYKTDYLSHLEDVVRTGRDNLGGGDNMTDSPGTEIMDEYNQGELREYYVEFEPLKRLKLRLGRQQVVWGETDFFRALDVVHGFDYRWRFFLEPENEEVRKPLILANVMIQVPEAGGSLQLLYRPGAGWNRAPWHGNTLPITGGRWNPQPYKGMDVLGPVKYDYDHPDGDTDDDTWGVRWSGIAGPINYSLAYLKTFNGDPVASTGLPELCYMKMPKALAADAIFPKIELVGATASAYAPWLDAVLSTEIVYTFHEPFNIGGITAHEDNLESSNVGPAILGWGVANHLPVDWNNVVPSSYLPGQSRYASLGPRPLPLIGVVERVLIAQPNGTNWDELSEKVIPYLQLVYKGAYINEDEMHILMSPGLWNLLGQISAASPHVLPQEQLGGLAQLILSPDIPAGDKLGQIKIQLPGLLRAAGINLEPNPVLSGERITDVMDPRNLRGYRNLREAFYRIHYLLGADRPLLVDHIGGFHGIRKKDSMMVMLRMDKNLAFTQWMFGAARPSFFTVQAFNHIILDFNKDDDIVRMMTFGEHRKEIETMITAVLALNYKNDRINPTLAGGWDASYGGFFAIPSVEFVYGDHWRLRLEADLFFPSGQKDPAKGNSYLDLTPLAIEHGSVKSRIFPGDARAFDLGNAFGTPDSNTSFLGFFSNNDQFLVRLTYQF